jgi:long-chain fatty acid transport protein
MVDNTFTVTLRTLRLLCGIAFIFATFATPSLAGGFRFGGQSASGAAQSQAFAAQADDPSAIHYNPAGMTQLSGVQISGGTNFVGGQVSFQSPTGATAKGDLAGSVAWPPPSNFYITANMKDIGLPALSGLTAGFGITSPFGLLIRYPTNGPFSTSVTSAALPLMDLKPTLAYKLNDQFSFGLGADVYTFASFIGEGQFEQKFNWPGGVGIPPGAPVEINGNGTGAGFNVSVLYTPLRQSEGKPVANIGIIYRSQAVLPVHGQFLVNGAAVAGTSASATLPDIIAGAMAIWPVRSQDFEWKLELDVEYEMWSKFRDLNVNLSTGGTLPFPQNWRNSVDTSVGTEIKWIGPSRLPHWDVAWRAGYAHAGSAVPDRTFSPAIAESSQNVISTGAGFLCKDKGKFFGLIPCHTFGAKALGLDMAFTAVLYESRTVTGNQNPTVNGLYQTSLFIGALNLRANF